MLLRGDADCKTTRALLQKSIKGLSTANADGLREQFGENRLTPPKTKAEWVKFCEHQSGFFSLLLWAGAILCFLGWGLQGAMDNVRASCPLVLCVTDQDHRPPKKRRFA